MIYNKHNLEVAKVASKSDMKPELACVLFMPDKTVATDTFRLVEMSTHKLDRFGNYPHESIDGVVTDKDKMPDGYLLPAREVLKHKIIKHKTLPELNVAVLAEGKLNEVALVSTNLEAVTRSGMRSVNGVFPKYDQVMPKDDDIAFSMNINAGYLAEVVKILGALNKYDAVTLHFQKGTGKALYITAKDDKGNQSAKALVMPMNR